MDGMRRTNEVDRGNRTASTVVQRPDRHAAERLAIQGSDQRGTPTRERNRHLLAHTTNTYSFNVVLSVQD
jgi:hypothetical protein